MRILLVCAAFPPYGKGGGPALSKLIADGVSGRGHQVRVITVADREIIESRSRFDVKVISSPNIYWNHWVSNPAWKKVVWHALENGNPRAFLQMRREIRDFGPDVVMTISIENINVATWFAAHLEKTPVVHFLQSYFLMCWRGALFKNDSNCSPRCVGCWASAIGKKFLSRYVNGVTGQSRFIVDKHIHMGYFRSALSCVIPGAVEIQPAATRAGPSQDELRVGFIGFHAAHKGIDTLAKAAALLASYERIRFVVAGDGLPEYTASLKRIFPPHNTRFVGWVRGEDFYPFIDVVVVPSAWQEPFGLVTIEAFSYGIPVIATRSGGLPEIIVEGESGFTFAAGDYDELSRIILLLGDDRDLLRRLGQHAAIQAAKFSVDKVAEAIERFFFGVLHNEGRTLVPR
jgi:glycosyltransferase involved in cell wall biosynthesis